MPRLLNQNQFAFTAGRQIADCSLIANEVVRTMSSRPQGGLLFKIDFAKAYDNVEWDFLLELLQEMGFGGRWIGWMQSCISTASLAVLVNGSPSEFFAIQKGLRQGDPLSPLLFNIVANGMSCMLNQLLGGEAPCGVEVAPGLRLNHL
ncbi:secreted RxLR effector protein 78-like [Lotus japonicus]|uniref:secreted RxLR effector protein 78-like n=1 Tax=Lotus japonicus TaxID=34305 RepID=UPI00258A20C1|nr:secreted RxLR effector protein 78-like [Lotus japonicus]